LVSEGIIVLIALSAGIAGGVWTPILAWMGSTDKFNLKKFCHALMTSIVAGLVWGIISLYAPPSNGLISLVIYGFGTFFTVMGVDFSRNKIGNMVRTPAT